jgi:hypothetical protein
MDSIRDQYPHIGLNTLQIKWHLKCVESEYKKMITIYFLFQRKWNNCSWCKKISKYHKLEYGEQKSQNTKDNYNKMVQSFSNDTLQYY